ncbi:MAG: Nif11-like leader peptide family RiPP precursor [Schwartzia sp.]|nr:Nif11-like leader peptide family RiPP precursor [Schwartzia sp. (in: firmicutes)]
METKIDPKLMTREMMAKATACETPEALVALGKENGVEFSMEEAKKILDELENLDVNLSDEDMAKVAGGIEWGCSGFAHY